MEVKLHAFPSRDREFLEFAQAAFNVLSEPRTTEALQRARRRKSWLFAGGLGGLLAAFSAVFAVVSLIGRAA